MIGKSVQLRNVTVAFAVLALVACEDSSGPGPRIVEGVNLDELFAPPTTAEIESISSEWAARIVSADGAQEEMTESVSLGSASATLSIVSHTVGGIKHYGAFLAPDGAAPNSLPIIVYAHGGDGGVNVDDILPALPVLLGQSASEYLFIAPSFRSEPLVYQGTTYQSGGVPSPWDRDVDDALALLNVALQIVPAADSERIGVIGFSRGAAVGMLMAERDPRIDLVVEFFGPTDFFGPFVQQLVLEALRGTPRDLPGLDYLNSTFVQPLKDGDLTTAEVRLELVRRSSVLYADRLPQLQIHHGTADDIVPVNEAERLIEVMLDLGRGAPEFEHYLYDGGGHNPLSLGGSIERTQAFVGRLLLTTLALR